jgi:hypothetical protein
MKFPKDYLGCADGLPKNDKRLSGYAKELKEDGWDSTELWNLDVTTIKFIYSRLVAFKKHAQDKKLVQSIIDDLTVDWEKWYIDTDGSQHKKVQRGFQKYIDNLFGFWT